MYFVSSIKHEGEHFVLSIKHDGKYFVSSIKHEDKHFTWSIKFLVKIDTLLDWLNTKMDIYFIN